MDSFEAIVKTLLEDDGFWTRQSVEVNVSKNEKCQIGKHTIPRTEIDRVAYKISVKGGSWNRGYIVS